ncbi:MAG: DUF3048 domain-containing protein [Thermoanaerobacteraceae bacterium]|nr:DUF3048 domain-containing protein [Thermoanaerobacteraceae bacterium]
MKRFILLFLILALLISGCSNGGKNEVEPSKNNVSQAEDMAKDNSGEKEEVRTYASKTTGISDSLPGDRLFAVIIENTPAARPQSGLIDADIVYEVLAEGGITRFLALFNNTYPEVVGPVRSARPYFVDIAKGWGAEFVHVGGSTQAYIDIQKLKLGDFDAMHMDKPFFKDKSRKDPHATYISLKALKEIKSVSNGYNYQFKFNDKGNSREVSSIDIPYNKDFDIKYIYDEEDGHYMRYIGDKAHTDRESGKQLYADNMIIEFHRHRVLDNEGRLEITMAGSGDAVIISGGREIKCLWERTGETSPVKYYDENGEEVLLNPGKTWINIVPTGLDIKID